MAIYQEKNKKKCTKDGRSWYFRVYYTDMYGNRKQKISKMYSGKTEAKDAERNFLNAVETKDFSNSNIMFKDVYTEWLNFKKQTNKSTTYYGMKKKCDKHILTYFENYKLHYIKVKSLLAWKEELGKKDLILESQNTIIGYFRQFLNYAKDNYDFDGKVVSKLQKYRTDTFVKDNIDKVGNNFWTYSEYQHFIKFVDDYYYKTIFEFMYYTGLRFGELSALSWNDIDLKKKILYIRKNLSTKVEDVPYVITGPKTDNSIRKIELDDNLVELLHKHYEKEKQLYDFNNDMFVFGNVRYIPATTFARKLDKYISLANVKRITPHGFRHSHVSLLIHLGCDMYEVADRIGDTVEMILDTYYHMFPEKKSHTIIVLNQLKLEK